MGLIPNEMGLTDDKIQSSTGMIDDTIQGPDGTY